MNEARKCPACGAGIAVVDDSDAPAAGAAVIGDIANDPDSCPACGFNLAGATEEIEMPAVGDSGSIGSCGEHGKPRLTLTKGPLKGEVFYLDSFPVIIGRDPSCDLFLNNMTVSREHAEIVCEGDQLVVRDKDSLNGTWVDNKVIEEAELFEGSLLQIGTFSMRFSCM